MANETISDRLRSNSTLTVCPFDKRSPDYYTTPNDKPCSMCGGEPEGPDKCTGADLRVMHEAAGLIGELCEALENAIPSTFEFDESTCGYYDTALTHHIRKLLTKARGEA